MSNNKNNGKNINFDEETFDIDDFEDLDVKINPSYYIHHCLMKLQTALVKDEWKSGFLQYFQLVEHLEIICKNTNIVDRNDFNNSFQKFIKSDEFKTWKKENKNNDLSEFLKTSNFKLSLLMESIFKSKISLSPLDGMSKKKS